MKINLNQIKTSIFQSPIGPRTSAAVHYHCRWPEPVLQLWKMSHFNRVHSKHWHIRRYQLKHFRLVWNHFNWRHRQHALYRRLGINKREQWPNSQWKKARGKLLELRWNDSSVCIGAAGFVRAAVVTRKCTERSRIDDVACVNTFWSIQRRLFYWTKWSRTSGNVQDITSKTITSHITRGLTSTPHVSRCRCKSE